MKPWIALPVVGLACSTGREMDVPLHPDYPVVSGHQRLSEEWSIDLVGKFNRRFEDGELVLWRPGVTFRISSWQDKGETRAERLRGFRSKISDAAKDVREVPGSDCDRLTYRVDEGDGDRVVFVQVCLLFSDRGSLMTFAYADRESDLEHVAGMLASVRAGGN
jgi:hypothetical protein